MKALLSVYDKTGIGEFGKGLVALGYEILSTGGTAKALQKAGVHVTEISDYTKFPEMLEGRVKTLHPKVHAGILAIRDKKEHTDTLKKHGIDTIDVVAVNLYPFEDTIAKKCTLEEAVEQIDIGGPTMLRAAAKNWQDVIVICDPSRYSETLDALRVGKVSKDMKYDLAREVFEHTARYDAAIANYLAREETPRKIFFNFEKAQELRYGENPHQKAAFYKESNITQPSIALAKQLHGKELSFNNILDSDAALRLILEFDEPVCAILKHNNPCGVAVNKKQVEAFKAALACDPTSAFGGIVIVNRELDGDTAEEINKMFIEVVIAPSYSVQALGCLKQKKNIRLLELEMKGKRSGKDLRKVAGGLLVQERDLELLKEKKCVTKRKPTKEEEAALEFAWKVCKHVKSNAIVYTGTDRTLGIGAGQMSRVDSARVGAEKAQSSLKGCVIASDAFFPFRDSIDEAAKRGVKAIIQPGGSIRDEEVIAACDEHGIAMVFTGMRHFIH